jgi:diguanylate cyclase (GGDEF)-like protein/PAS domain S-box-containing protein
MSDEPALCASTSAPEAGAARRLQAILDALPDLLFEVDLAGRYLDYHSPRTDLLAAPAEVFIGKTLHELLPKAIADDCLAALYEAHAKGFCQGCRIELMLPQGPSWFELSISRKDNGPDQPVSFIVLSRDVSQHVVAERKVQRLTQLYAALSQCNQAILRCQSEAELFPIICADAVKFGGMKLAWIGVMDAATGLIKPVTWVGEGSDALSGLVIDTNTDASRGLGLSDRALRAGEPYWFQDFANDPDAQVCHNRARTYGWGAAASLPLHRRGQLAGLLTVYAGEVHAFDEAVRSLLLEMAMDISFALDRFADEVDRRRTLLSLADSEERYRKAFHTSPDAVNINRLSDSTYIDVNEGFERLTGWSRAEVIGRTSLEFSIWRSVAERTRMLDALSREGVCSNLEAEFFRKDGAVVTVLMSVAVVRLDDEDCFLSITRDITEKKRADERITQLAHFDQLTGLPNRSQLQARFEFARQLAQRSGEGLALMFLDLDHFKNINDTLGHSIGDRLLVQVAQRLSTTLRAGDTLSRMGGDEFILLLPSVTEESASQIAMKLLKVMSEPFRIDSYELVNTLSIGIAVYPYDGLDFETLSKNADTAMYRVKQASHNNFAFFTQEMQLHSARNLQLSTAMHFALARGEFSLHYQPQLSLQDDNIVGAEALLRWRHPELGSLSPAEFIPIAEDSGQILAIGEWVLRTAVSQLKRWMDAGMKPMVMAVNLSAVQFRHPNLLTMVTRVLDEVGLPPQYLELELTEASTMDDPLAAVDVMDQLHARGIRMAIDDFGTGYSSLSYLKKFKVSRLKIDQSFVRDIGDDPDDKAIVTAIINLAKSMGMQTIAEGVETAHQMTFLRLQGCTDMQGYHFSKPLPSEQFEAFVRDMPLKARPASVLATQLTRCSILPEGLVALTATAYGMVGNTLVQAARQAFSELMPAIHLAGVLTQVGSFMSLVPDNAQAPDDPDCRYVAAALFGYSLANLSGECHKPDLRLSGTLAWQAIASGRYAVFTHVGPYDTLFQSWATIRNSWLPTSGERERQVPSLELMLNDPQTTPPELLRTEIWIPLM